MYIVERESCFCGLENYFSSFFFFTLLARRCATGRGFFFLFLITLETMDDVRETLGPRACAWPSISLYLRPVFTPVGEQRINERHMRGRASTKANYRMKWAQSAGHLFLADDVCSFSTDPALSFFLCWLAITQYRTIVINVQKVLSCFVFFFIFFSVSIKRDTTLLGKFL